MRIFVINDPIKICPRGLHGNIIAVLSGLVISSRIPIYLIFTEIRLAAKNEDAYGQRRKTPATGARFENVPDLLETAQHISTGARPGIRQHFKMRRLQTNPAVLRAAGRAPDQQPRQQLLHSRQLILSQHQHRRHKKFRLDPAVSVRLR